MPKTSQLGENTYFIRLVEGIVWLFVIMFSPVHLRDPCRHTHIYLPDLPLAKYVALFKKKS